VPLQRKRARRRIAEAKRTGQPPPADAVALLEERPDDGSARRMSASALERAPSPSYEPYKRQRRAALRSAVHALAVPAA
jgi:hypothetical protein